MNSRRGVLHVRNLPVIDTFQFFGPSNTPALVDFRVEWHATGSPTSVGMGTLVPPTDPKAFLGEIAPAVSTVSFSAEEIGFRFESDGRASTSPAGTHRLERSATAYSSEALTNAPRFSMHALVRAGRMQVRRAA